MNSHGLKKTLLFLLIILIYFITSVDSYAQTDSLNLLEDNQEEQKLLPDKMMFTQRLLYGQKGLFRITGIIPLTPENRIKEMKWRRALLVVHQVVGIGTVGTMIATGITGSMLYQGDYSIKEAHTTLAAFTNGGYIIGATLSFTVPPTLVAKRGKKWSSIDWHRALAYVHLAGMITTNLLASKAANEGGDWKKAHAIAGGITALTFTAAFLTITF